MTTPTRPELVFGGTAFIVGGVLLFGGLLCLALLPAFSPGSVALWAENNVSLLAMSDELLAFAILALLPAAIILCGVLSPAMPARALLLTSTFILALVTTLIVVIVQGRLAYPIIGLSLDESSTTLVASAFYGALHMAVLLFAFAALLFGFLLRGMWTWLRAVSVLAGLMLLPAAYPWMTPLWLDVAAVVGLLAWTLGNGLWMLRLTSPPPSTRSRR